VTRLYTERPDDRGSVPGKGRRFSPNLLYWLWGLPSQLSSGYHGYHGYNGYFAGGEGVKCSGG
jgi:hypothetical protein